LEHLAQLLETPANNKSADERPQAEGQTTV
jgi:hypothetical protein